MPRSSIHPLSSRQHNHVRIACAAALYVLAAGAIGGCALRTRAAEGLEDNDSQAGASGATSATRTSDVSEGPTDVAARSSARGPAANSSTDTAASTAGAGPAATLAAGSGGSSAGTSAAAGSSGISSATAGASGAAPVLDAGIPQPHAAGSVSTLALDKCDTELAQCIIDSPLNYDGCLRRNADNGCAAPDAGVPDTSVLDANGNPISQVCQAELAKCIMQEPTPEHALACTEMARSCK